MTRLDFLLGSATTVGDADAALAFEQQPGRQRMGDDFDTAPGLGRKAGDIGAIGGAAQPALSGHLGITDPVLPCAIQVRGIGKTRLLRRSDEHVGQRQDRAIILDLQRAGGSAIRWIAALQIGLGASEQRQDLVKAPAAAAGLRPAVKIRRIAPHVKHAVDRAGPAQHLAARRVQGAVPGRLLRLGCIKPVVALGVDQLGHASRNMDHRVQVFSTRFQQGNSLPCLGQSSSNRASGRACAHNDVIKEHRSLFRQGGDQGKLTHPAATHHARSGRRSFLGR